MIACLAVVGCDGPEAQAPPPPFVAVMEVALSDVPASAGMISHLDSPQNVEIGARVEGFVDKMSFVEGTQVQEGDVLFELDRKPYLEKIAAAQGSFAESIAALNKYEKDVARLRTGKGIPGRGSGCRSCFGKQPAPSWLSLGRLMAPHFPGELV